MSFLFLQASFALREVFALLPIDQRGRFLLPKKFESEGHNLESGRKILGNGRLRGKREV
jgi:hypothetical protein